MALEEGKSEKTRLMDSGLKENLIDIEENVMTSVGMIRVVARGDRRYPAIVTYHDIGLNSKSCFENFFSYPDMKTIMKNFCVFHINALGQQPDALALPLGLGKDSTPAAKDYLYPTMDQLALSILPVLEHFGIKSFIGFGVGAGANVLSRFALCRPERVEALVLVNGNASQAGWIEWAFQKWNAWYLKSNMMTNGIKDYLFWHWFGDNKGKTDSEILNTYLDHLQAINRVNLGHFIGSYIKRTDLGIWRELDPLKKANARNFSCPVMLVAGDESAHLDDTVEMNGRLDPSNSNFVKFSCSGLVLEECPGNMSEAFLLFLQGMGYVTSLRSSVDINPARIPAHLKIQHANV